MRFELTTPTLAKMGRPAKLLAFGDESAIFRHAQAPGSRFGPAGKVQRTSERNSAHRICKPAHIVVDQRAPLKPSPGHAANEPRNVKPQKEPRP